MSTTKTIGNSLQDPLTSFKLFEKVLALFLGSIPLILFLTDKKCNGSHDYILRQSISDYVYMWHSYVYGLLLGTAAILFILTV